MLHATPTTTGLAAPCSAVTAERIDRTTGTIRAAGLFVAGGRVRVLELAANGLKPAIRSSSASTEPADTWTTSKWSWSHSARGVCLMTSWCRPQPACGPRPPTIPITAEDGPARPVPFFLVVGIVFQRVWLVGRVVVVVVLLCVVWAAGRGGV